MSAASEYAELLKLIEVSGPFISLPVFKEVFPQGLVKDSSDQTRELREIYDEWQEARKQSPGVVSPTEREWLRAVFTVLLEWPAEHLVEHNAIPQNLAYFVAQHREALRPDLVLMEGDNPRLLITFLPPSQQPDRRPAATTWNATCAGRMAELLHATRVPLGLVTNGERFTLVYAEPGQPTGFADFRAELWFEERLTLRAFRDFLSADALFNRPPEQTLDALYRRSLENQQEVSTTLGRQVRRAVEMFVAALDRADRESSGTLLRGVPEELVYEAALTLMMRLVFLFFAEERDLLPISNLIYHDNYAVSTLHDQLREAADRLGEEVLERRYDAFPRLLATFRAVHGGINHDLAALPAYGGELFDPDRFPFLEGRKPETRWQAAGADPFPIHNRTVLHLLQALQFLEMKVPGGGRESRRLSFRALDIEQIGHVYEGLLDHTVRRAAEIVLGLDGKKQPEIALSELNRRRVQPDFVDWLAEETGRTEKAIEKALGQTAIQDPLRWPEWDQVAPFAGLVRRDDNGEPCVIPAGSLYVTVGTARRQTGTQYTPRTLTESVVEHALEPLVYSGPAEGEPPEAWRLKSADQILDLKICDFACGSAAFLVAAGRYLSARLVEAWEVAQKEHGVNVQITPYGHKSSGLPEEELIPSNPDERGLYALRIVVERCLYGVDRNPLAVEMAKLSLWLLTLQRSRPFTFLDHSIRCGDSLLGVDLKQLSTWSLSGEGKQKVLFQDDLSFAASKREGLMKMMYRTSDQKRMLDAALEKTRRLRAAADRLIATAFEANYEAAAAAITFGFEEQEAEAKKILEGRRPFHWAVEFPEVFLHGGGFDAIVGNPPFMGGQRITGAFGTPYRDYLVKFIADGKRGSADYVAYFFLRAFGLLKDGGSVALLATNTIAQGDTGEVGLDQMIAQGATIWRAIRSSKWPGEASLEVAHVWMRKGPWHGAFNLDGEEVPGISSALTLPGRITGKPHRLSVNARKSFKGSEVGGMEAFVISKETLELLKSGDENADGIVLRPFLGYEDLVANESQESRRWCIYFADWPLERAESYPTSLAYVRNHIDETTRTGWWQFRRPTPELYRAIAGNRRVLVIGETSEAVSPVFVPNGQVFTKTLIVFASDASSTLALIASSLHYVWVLQHGSTLETRAKYIISDCFETFPFPISFSSLESIGERYHATRTGIMLERQVGLTKLSNLFHDPDCPATDIQELRDLLRGMDHAVAATYGWTDINLGHGFHETKQGVRYTISEAARREVLDRLLALNQERYAQEQADLLSAPKPKSKPRKRTSQQAGLF